MTTDTGELSVRVRRFELLSPALRSVPRTLTFAAWGRLFQIESLREFNRKFQPDWLPRSIVIEDPADLPRVGVLYASVEGFLKLPLIGGLLVPSVPSSNGAAPAAEAETAAKT